MAGLTLLKALAAIPKMAEDGDPNKIFAKIALCMALARAPPVSVAEDRLLEIKNV